VFVLLQSKGKARPPFGICQAVMRLTVRSPWKNLVELAGIEPPTSDCQFHSMTARHLVVLENTGDDAKDTVYGIAVAAG